MDGRPLLMQAQPHGQLLCIWFGGSGGSHRWTHTRVTPPPTTPPPATQGTGVGSQATLGRSYSAVSPTPGATAGFGGRASPGMMFGSGAPAAAPAAPAAPAVSVGRVGAG